MDIETLFYRIDDFCQNFEPVFKQKLLAEKPPRGVRSERLSLSEVMTIIVNIVAGLIAYSDREKKPSLNIDIKELALLSA